ncbi:MAG: VWA domain-containing protein [Planctomycetes bacterium]|nr:VWA domain-containing protein [Planctomycetota bacterium]
MKIKSLLLLALLANLVPVARSQVAEPKNLFFVIDVSGSMETNKIFKPLKSEITKYIQNEVNKGDYVSVISFGTDVKLIAGQRISQENTATDIDLLVEKVNRLSAKEQYTHMTRALDLLASQMGLVKSANPNGMVKAFLFTDGKNEPPPGAEGANWTFEQILQKHYDIFEKPSTYLFIITLGIQPDEELVKAAAEKKGKIFINSVPDVSKLEGKNIIPKGVPKPEPIIEPKPEPIRPSVKLAFSGPSKLLAKATSRYDLIIEVKELNKEAVGKTLSLGIEIAPPVNLSYTDKAIVLKDRGKKKIPISIERPNPGSYRIHATISSSERMDIEPTDFESALSIKKPDYTPFIVILLLAAVAFGIWLFLHRIPKFTEEQVLVNTKENLTYELKEKQKWYSPKVTSKDLEITEAEFSLELRRKTGEVVCRALIDGEWVEKIVQSGEMVVDPYKYEVKMI